MRKTLRATPILLGALLFAGRGWAGPYTPGLAATLDSYLTSVGSPLAGMGTQLFNDGVLYNVDPRLVVAIAGTESNFGISATSCPFDPWMLLPPSACGPFGLATYSAGVDAVTLALRQLYLDGGFTSIPLIGASYFQGTFCGSACVPAWISTVTSIYTGLGGDPTDLTFGGGPLITFEDHASSSPSVFAAYTTGESVSYSIDAATTVSFNGGVTLSAATNLPGDQSTVYGTADFCLVTVCSPTVTINFTAPVINFSVYMVNGNTVTVTYTVVDNLGNSNQVTLVPNFSSGLATVALPPTDAVTQVTISAGTPPAGACCAWDYFIDNVNFAATQ